MFVRYSLRTTDVASARTFYQRALGLALPEGASPSTSLEAWPLHELARSRGAPAHWLGHLAVDDLEHALGELMALGAETLGPTVRAPSGAAWAAIRDPLGAVLALRARGDAPPDRPIAWHQLHTTDLDRAWPLYARLAGWRDAGRIEAIDPQGGHQLFTWTDAPAGSIASTARWPGVHAQWLFYFPVDDVDAAVARVRDHGGTALVPITLPSGARMSACEDPQRAAFGVMQRA